MPRARRAVVVQPLWKTPAPVDPRWQFTLGPEFIAWTEAQLRIPRGPRRGEPMRWSAWQKEFWNEALRCDADGNWFYRMVLLGVPKKNTKSGMASSLATWHVFGDPYEVDPWVPIGASSDEQADIIFGDAKTMAELNPDMKAAANLFKGVITLKDVQSGHPHIERVASSKGHLDGKDATLVAYDEVHECEQESWRILTNSIVGRPRAMVFATTTAGHDKETVLGRLFDRCVRQARGELPGDRTLMWWYGAPDGADYREPMVWAAANPNYGVTVTEETLRHELSKNSEAEYRRYFTNQWTKTENVWLPKGALEACEAVEAFDLVEGAETFIGWDASTKVDSTAVVMGQWFELEEQGEDGKPVTVKVLGVKCWHWERPVDMNGNFDEEWVLPLRDEVVPLLEGAFRKFDVKDVRYDPAFITWEAADLLKAGQPMVEWPQTDVRMVPATAALYSLIVEQRLLFFGEPALVRHIENSVAVQTRRGGVRLAKTRDRKMNDLAIALVMMVSGAMPEAGEEEGIVAFFGGEREKGREGEKERGRATEEGRAQE